MKVFWYCFVYSSLVLAGLFIATASYAQHGTFDTLKVHAHIAPEGDTLEAAALPQVWLFTHTHMTREMRRKYEAWTRLRNAVYVTYPYAISASKIINDINLKLGGVTDKKKRKAIIHSREKELKKEFADRITNLSIYQGKVLMKLIYRETGNNCYEIIEEYKGWFTAAFWQTVAVVFGNNLKQEYDPLGDDREMEIIVREVAKMYK